MTGLDLPRLGLGGASIGNLYREVPEETVRATLETAWESGIRYFDTAPHYGLGLSERRLGTFLRDRPREEFVISTKVGRLLVDDPDWDGARRDLDQAYDVPADRVRVYDPSESGIRRSLEASLERLGLDRVDILYLHDPDVYDLDRGIREGLPALAALREEGLVRQIGIGTNDADAATRAVLEGDLDLVMIAGRYTLLEQPALDRLLPAAETRDVGIVAVGVFNSGLLSRDEPAPDATHDYEPAPPDLLARARRLAARCREYGVELPAAALQYPLRHPAVRSVVIGAGSPGHLAENVARLEAEIPSALWERLIDEGLIR